MEDMPGDPGKSEPGPSNITGWPLDFMENLRSLSLVSQEKTLSSRDSQCFLGRAETSSQTASQVLWSTGTLSGPIPNGFYSIIPDKKLKELFDAIPFPDVLLSLGMEGLKADIILVDAEKDKKLSMLKQLSAAFGKGLNSNPASLIKKVAGLVSDFYKHPNSELTTAKAAGEDISHLTENRGIQLLGQIRHGSCRPRAILFKVLADVVGLESKLLVGLPSDGPVEYTDSCRHMSVTVMVNSVELLVDLMRSPGQIIPFSAKAMFMSHIAAATESDSADYDSCDSPLEPNSPLYSFYDKTDSECQEYDEKLRLLYQQRVEASWKLTGSSLQKPMLRPSTYSEGNLSPENPLNRARGPSLLSGNRHPFREYSDGMAVSRSDGASTSNTRRTRQRSLSITPVIGDDIVRAVRAMNEKLKQTRLLRDQTDESSRSQIEKDNINDSPRVVSHYHLDGHDKVFRRRHKNTQKAISLPSSPHEIRGRTSEIYAASNFLSTEDLISRWNNVLQSSSFLNTPLLPFQDWSIDFSELTVGRRIGLGFFGEVFQGMWNGTDVAIKVFLEQDLTTENMEDFCNEISIMSRLRHPNVVLFLGACMKPPHLSMVTEYMEYGSLYHLIHNSGQKKKLSWRRRLKMLRDICRGLMCMHRMKIIHRDLKSANCLVNKHWAVKICDFGLSRVMAAPTSDVSSAGTPEWMAPELIRGEPFTEKCDIFSLGVIMWELCTLNRPWQGVPKAQVVYSVANEGTRLEIPEGPLGSLISDCWAEPNKRPSCQEILTRLLDCEYTLC